MKRILLATAITAVTVIATPALAADVGVSISIGQPGFYGRLDIGGYPPPRVLYREPIAIRRVPVARPPIYLRVPPGHARNWARHCRTYNACGERVYFVQDRWYNNEYVPRYQRYQRDRQHQRRQRQDQYRYDNNPDNRDYRQQGTAPWYNNNNDGYQNDR
ncbi:hypothetical protein C8E02_1234 [Vogesella indigofera]|uniref:Uncharacterized protein n=1 Tax=Vogesella indigofera TaxID=45465 RepID=A0A495BJD9_VOGIN|nr:hypothetical protein [Vogesella indigofera]RKQ61459.1 hypothetical protein C8E02_1234 [Vogesella indigofera]